MTDDPSVSLAAIESALRSLDRKALLQSLQPGLSVDAVRSSLDLLGLPYTTDLLTLYGWRNGTASESAASLDDIQIFPGFHLLSLDDAVANYQEFVSDSRWNRGWLPVFANGGGTSMSWIAVRPVLGQSVIFGLMRSSTRSSSLR